MKKKEEIVAALNDFSVEDKTDLEYLRDTISRILEENKITEDSVKELEGVMYTLLTLRERHYNQLLTWLKQGHQL